MPRTGQGGGAGGRRQGTPGKGYSNRTDLTRNYDNTTSAATGGMELPPTPPASPAAAEPAAPPTMMRYPEESPMLSDPTMRPDEPLTAGLSTGAGPGREVLGLGGGPKRPTLTETLRKVQLYSSDPQIQAILRVAAPRGW